MMNRRLPAEWEEHQGILLSWPHNQETWPQVQDQVFKLYFKMMDALLYSEEVYLLVPHQELVPLIHNVMGQHEFFDRLKILVKKTNDAWARDYGPMTIIENGKRLALDFGFNMWGGKYPPWDHDNEVPKYMSEILGIPSEKKEIVLEGGSIDCNGEGVLLTSKSCLLNPNRNPSMTQNDIEVYLTKSFGLRKILWLEEGIIGDDTDGHIDDMTRFVAKDHIVTVREANDHDENFSILEKNYQELLAMTDADGNPFKVTSMPMPSPVFDLQGNRLPASYANFLIANKVILLPQFEDEKDHLACEIMASCFPERRVVPIPCRELIVGLGALHCISMQIPKVTL